MDSTLKIAIILSAFDKMSSVVDAATENAKKKFKGLMNESFIKGGVMFETGKKILTSLEPAIDAFGEAQAAGNELKASMMGPGGLLDENTYKKIYSMANTLSDKYKGSTASYLDMVKVLKNNRLNENDILGGIGESTAKLADFFQMTPATIAEFSAHMKNDMGVAVGDMSQMMDTIARVHNAGVGKTGSEAVTEMNEFFSKASLGAANLGVQGVEATKQLGALGAMFMARGLSGATVGTNFRRIFDGMRDASKLKKANEEAAKFGVHLEMFDKKGKFLGMNNFVDQLGKLEHLDPQAIQGILKAFSGKQGLSTDFLEYLGKEGIKGYSDFNKKIAEQATLDQKLSKIMGGLNYEQGVMGTSWTNLKSTFGSALEPALSLFYNTMNKIIVAVREFLDQHPRLAKFAGAFVAMVGAAVMLGGIVKIIQGIRIAMTLLNITMAANPFLLIVTAVITAVALIYAYWEPIKEFFIKLWAGIKEVFTNVWNWIKNTFLNYTPMGLIIKHWGAIKKWFADLWQGIKDTCNTVWEAIKSIVVAPIEWIKEKWGQLTDWFEKTWNKIKGWARDAFSWFTSPVDSMVKKMKEDQPKLEAQLKSMGKTIDDYLPHSPAKKGPLMRLDKVRIVETIAETMKPQAIIRKMQGITHSIAGAGFKGSGAGTGTSNGGITMVFHLNGGATQADAKIMMAEAKKQFGKNVKQYEEQKQRVGFG